MIFNLTQTLIVIFVTTSMVFPQNKIQLNVSESQRNFSFETLESQNITSGLSISDFKRHHAIRNNEINKNDSIICYLEDFENKEGKLNYKNKPVKTHEPSENFMLKNASEAHERWVMDTNSECNSYGEDPFVELKILLKYTQTSISFSKQLSVLQNIFDHQNLQL